MTSDEVDASPGTFTHRVDIIRHRPLPVCADCGEPSTLELINVTSMGDEVPVLMERPTLQCPNGPHVRIRAIGQ